MAGPGVAGGGAEPRGPCPQMAPSRVSRSPHLSLCLFPRPLRLPFPLHSVSAVKGAGNGRSPHLPASVECRADPPTPGAPHPHPPGRVSAKRAEIVSLWENQQASADCLLAFTAVGPLRPGRRDPDASALPRTGGVSLVVNLGKVPEFPWRREGFTHCAFSLQPSNVDWELSYFLDYRKDILYRIFF